MRLPFVVLTLVLLSACGLGGGNASTPQVQCEQEAENDPAVLAIYSRTNGAYTYPFGVHEDLVRAKQAATTRCLRAKGLAPPGGVQAVRPR